MPVKSGAAPVPAAALEREVIITRILDAPRSLVFKAWTDPKHVQRWVGSERLHKPCLRTGCASGRRLAHRHARAKRRRLSRHRRLPRDRGTRAPCIYDHSGGPGRQHAPRWPYNRDLRRARREDKTHLANSCCRDGCRRGSVSRRNGSRVDADHRTPGGRSAWSTNTPARKKTRRSSSP